MRHSPFLNITLTICLFVVLFLLSPFHTKIPKNNALKGQEFSRATVKKILKPDQKGTQKVKVLVKEGSYKNEEFTVTNYMSYGNKLLPLKYKDNVLLLIEDNDKSNLKVTIYEYIREKKLFYLICIFSFLVILIGGLTGLRALVSVAFTICVISILLLPGLLSGYNPIKLTVICSLIISFFSLILQNGLNKKSIAAFIGTLGGIIISAIVTSIMSSSLKVSINSEEMAQLLKLPQNIDFDFQGLLFSSIIIGALGANIDMSMSVASAMNEIKESNKYISNTEFIKCGMSVGKDVIGTMCTTLILAYVGSALVNLMIFIAYNTSFSYIINLEEISTEILRALAGSMGIILSVPLTVFTRVLID